MDPLPLRVWGYHCFYIGANLFLKLDKSSSIKDRKILMEELLSCYITFIFSSIFQKSCPNDPGNWRIVRTRSSFSSLKFTKTATKVSANFYWSSVRQFLFFLRQKRITAFFCLSNLSNKSYVEFHLVGTFWIITWLLILNCFWMFLKLFIDKEEWWRLVASFPNIASILIMLFLYLNNFSQYKVA